MFSENKANKFLKQKYYEIGSRTTKVLAKQIRKLQTVITIFKIREPQTNKIFKHQQNIERIFQTWYKELHTHNFPEPQMKEARFFLSIWTYQQLAQHRNETLTAYITKEEIVEVIN